MFSVVRLPLDLLSGLAEAVHALAALPAELERTIRDTNALMAALRTELGGLHDQVERIAVQLETMGPVIEGLVERTTPLIDVADAARRELVAATAQLTATGQSLERALQMAAPLDLVGKRIADRFRRVTRQGGPTET